MANPEEHSEHRARTLIHDEPIALVDIETTGSLAVQSRITEIAIIGMTGPRVDFRWQSLVNPQCPIPSAITHLTGIDDALVATAPAFTQIAGEVADRLEGRLFVAHNVRFDYTFIRSEFWRLGVRWQRPTLCTVRLSRRLFPRQARHSLDAVISSHGFQCDQRHRAMGDTEVLRQFWQLILGRFPGRLLDTAVAALRAQPQAPAQIDADTIAAIPQAPGVYELRSQDATLLYVGKSQNMRSRVVQHFAGSHRDEKSARLAAQTHSITFSQTAGELGALLLEARRVREAAPVYNRKLRTRQAFSWIVDPQSGIPRLTQLDWTTAGFQGVYGAFRTAAGARKALKSVVRAWALCEQVLGLTKSTGGACFASQIGKCRGACTGLESRQTHQLRFLTAISAWRMPAWPHSDAVGIIERGPGGTGDVIVVDRWQWLGTLSFPTETEAVDEGMIRARCAELLGRRNLTPSPFELEEYQILREHWAGIRGRLRIIDLASPHGSDRCVHRGVAPPTIAADDAADPPGPFSSMSAVR